MTLLDIYTLIMTTAGLFFFLSGTIGLLRFPDTLTRLHALTKVDNVGLGLIVLGVLPVVQSIFQVLQLLLIWLVVMVCSVINCLLMTHNEQTGERNND